MDAAALNRMIANRARDLATAKPAGAPKREAALRALGLLPLPPRTDLAASSHGTIPAAGCRIERVAYFSRPGVRVTAHLYLPESDGPAPAIVVAVGHWPTKKSASVFQAFGIGHAAQGFAVLVVDSPGSNDGAAEGAERTELGAHDDATLMASSPVSGIYAWDLVRGVDYLSTRSEIDVARVGIAGASAGAVAALGAFVADDRLRAMASFCGLGAQELSFGPPCLCNTLPGALGLGDWAAWCSLRSPAPVLLVAARDDAAHPAKAIEATAKRMKSSRLEVVEGGHDLNRRMREASLAFFGEHLQGLGRAPYRTESVPLTDGDHFSARSNTREPDDPELRVLGPYDMPPTTLRELRDHALAEPYPEPFVATERLVNWGRYGRLPTPVPATTLLILERPGPEEAVSLPVGQLDLPILWRSGLGGAEFYAQLIHLLLPGGPEGWESVATGGDVITSMIASMRTLVKQSQPAEPLTEVVAEGPVASLTASFLKLLRPSLQVTTSHQFQGWQDLLNGPPELVVPACRYLRWPFSN